MRSGDKVTIDAEAICLCGGTLGVNTDGVLVHSLPTCAEYDGVETYDQAADLVRRCREKMERS